MRINRKVYFLLTAGLLLLFASFNSGCHVYSFKDVTIPDSIKSIRINFIENRAPYVNPQISPVLTERLRRKIQSQTRLTLTNSDDAHYDVHATVTDYSVTTSGISQKTESLNRLTVAIHVVLTNQLSGNQTPTEFDVSRSFDFGANLSLQAAEAQLFDEMIRNLTDDIFNRLFSNW